jgi:hypothetical protein
MMSENAIDTSPSSPTLLSAALSLDEESAPYSPIAVTQPSAGGRRPPHKGSGGVVLAHGVKEESSPDNGRKPVMRGGFKMPGQRG